MGKGSLVDFCSEEDRKRLLNFRSDSELLPKSKVRKPDLPPPASDVCEFAGAPVYPGSVMRRCADGSCPIRVCGNLEIYRICFIRSRKLKEKKGAEGGSSC